MSAARAQTSVARSRCWQRSRPFTAVPQTERPRPRKSPQIGALAGPLPANGIISVPRWLAPMQNLSERSDRTWAARDRKSDLECGAMRCGTGAQVLRGLFGGRHGFGTLRGSASFILPRQPAMEQHQEIMGLVGRQPASDRFAGNQRNVLRGRSGNPRQNARRARALSPRRATGHGPWNPASMIAAPVSLNDSNHIPIGSPPGRAHGRRPDWRSMFGQ